MLSITNLFDTLDECDTRMLQVRVVACSSVLSREGFRDKAKQLPSKSQGGAHTLYREGSNWEGFKGQRTVGALIRV